MAQVHESGQSRHVTRRAPNAQDAAVQEAKRLEKLQSHSSSHRAGDPGVRPAEAGNAAAAAAR